MKIIGISGRKQSGKNTVANYINGHVLKSMSMVDDFNINPEGKLEVQTRIKTGELGWGILELSRKDESFVNYAERELWPYIKIYHFADSLKKICIDLFGLKENLVYGNNDDKNTLTDICWENVPENNGRSGPMTIREFLEYFGTNIIRKIKGDAWVSHTINSIINERSQISLIPDVRFPNEVEAVKRAGGIVIRLTRDIFASTSDSESALDQNKYDWTNFDIVLDNSNMSLSDLCAELESKKHTWSA